MQYYEESEMFKTRLVTPESPRSDRDDRRQHHLKSLFYSLFMRRRRQQRRAEDQQKSHYLDLHDPIYMYVAVGILVLSCTDAVFTLTLLSMGAREANPVMQFFLEINTSTFIAIKVILTILSVIFLVAHRNFWLLKRTIKVETLLFAALVMYLLLINYEIVLMSSIAQ